VGQVGVEAHESKQRAKYYQLTALGKKQLISDRQRWSQLVHAIGAVMEPEVKPQ